jgi:integral membrane protein
MAGRQVFFPGHTDTLSTISLLNSEDPPVTTADVTTAEDGKLARFRLVSLAEGVSFLLLLCVGMPLKYGPPHLAAPTMVFGMIHGLLFLAYLALAYDAKQAQNWDAKRFGTVLIASVLPTGPFWLHKSLKK